MVHYGIPVQPIHPVTIFPRLATPALPVLLALLASCASAPSQPGAPVSPISPIAPLSAFVILGEEGAVIARAITAAPACPALTVDGQAQPMTVRAQPAHIAQRSANQPTADAKPSDFPVLTCEASLPRTATHASIAGQALALPKGAPQRIVVIGDTGCRLLKKDASYQNCNLPGEYPFAQIAAQAAAWHPDLVIHVGDYHYRESPCPADMPGCAGSPWGYGWDAWQADLFAPGAALLKAAPWVVARGNHESCTRAGQGWWRFLDPRPLLAGRDCERADDDANGNYSDPYAIPLGPDSQLLVLDTASGNWHGIQPTDVGWEKFRNNYRQLDALARRAPHNLLLMHHPLLGLGADINKADGKMFIVKGDLGLQQAFGSVNPALFPASVHAVLSGHVHVWEQTSFSSDHPTQLISGFSGTAEDIVPVPLPPPPGLSPAPGAVLKHISAWIDGFGFMTLQRQGPEQWLVGVHDLHGQLRNQCRVDGRQSVCERMQVH